MLTFPGCLLWHTSNGSSPCKTRAMVSGENANDTVTTILTFFFTVLCTSSLSLIWEGEISLIKLGCFLAFTLEYRCSHGFWTEKHLPVKISTVSSSQWLLQHGLWWQLQWLQGHMIPQLERQEELCTFLGTYKLKARKSVPCHYWHKE